MQPSLVLLWRVQRLCVRSSTTSEKLPRQNFLVRTLLTLHKWGYLALCYILRAQLLKYFWEAMWEIPLHNVMQLMSISIIVMDTILNSERLLTVLSLLLQSLSNDSLTLLLEHPVAHSRKKNVFHKIHLYGV